MRAFCDGLSSAPQPVPKDELVLAALGPKMLDLAKERLLGTHPYFVSHEHTAFARDRVGPDALVAPEGRRTQRRPMWLMPVSTICGRRAAGR